MTDLLIQKIKTYKEKLEQIEWQSVAVYEREKAIKPENERLLESNIELIKSILNDIDSMYL